MPLHGLKNVKQAIDDKVDDVNQGVRGAYLQGLTNIIIESPVLEGMAANGWFLSQGAASTKLPTKSSKSGADSLARLYKMPDYVLGKKMFYANNLPYINRLNYTDWARVPGTRGWVNREVTQMLIAIRRIK